MKTSNRYTVKPGNIHSLEDIRLEKMRLRLEILKTETSIHEGYRDILQALSLKNLATSIINDISTSSTMVTRAFSFGKSLLEKRKKKKQDRMKEVPGNPPVESE
jgi:hypothetical protein